LKDDRGNRRDQDRSDRMNGDRPDGSPSHERQMGNHDEAMYDAYGGPGVPAFTSDMPPPPVLMPVPGAGLVSLSILLHLPNLIHLVSLIEFWLVLI